MSALTVYQGLEERWRTVEGLAGGVQLGEPTAIETAPLLYVVYASFDRPLRNAPPANNLTGMRHQFGARLAIQWVDNPAAEMQLLTLLDAIPDAIDRDPQLGQRLMRGMAWCSDGITGFATIGGVRYRVVDYTIIAMEKRQGT